MTLINPFLSWPVSQGWRQGTHALPGGGPAIDYAMPTGTPLRAPMGGRVATSAGGDAGNVVTITNAFGQRIVLCHLSRFVPGIHGRTVAPGDIVGWSGQTGKATGPHLHTYGLTATGARWDWTLDAARETPATDDSTPFTPDLSEEDDDMRFQIIHRSEPGYDDEWMLVHPELDGGFVTTTDQARALAWTRLYRFGWIAKISGPDGRYTAQLGRADYLQAQRAAAEVRASWVRGR